MDDFARVVEEGDGRLYIAQEVDDFYLHMGSPERNASVLAHIKRDQAFKVVDKLVEALTDKGKFVVDIKQSVEDEPWHRRKRVFTDLELTRVEIQRLTMYETRGFEPDFSRQPEVIYRDRPARTWAEYGNLWDEWFIGLYDKAQAAIDRVDGSIPDGYWADRASRPLSTDTGNAWRDQANEKLNKISMF